MLAVTGGKGGTGKTTAALGIATSLSKRRRNPVVIDADVDMPNLHIRAGVDDTGLDALASGVSLSTAATESERLPGVDIVGATPGTDLEQALRNLRTERPVILDGAAGVSERAVTPLRHADQAVVVTRATPASVTDSVKSIRMSRAVETPLVGVLLSQSDAVSQRIRETLSVSRIHPVPDVPDPITHEAVRPAYDSIVETWANA
ncbi:MAG: MinD/ParA family ATP-binding protein [Halodesulfurarchaeum sp.]